MIYKNSSLKTFLLINSIIIISLYNNVNGLKCYSCSSTSGDSFCHEDSFDETKVKLVECPEGSDVCVRAIQTKSERSNAGAIFRACGSSEKSDKKEVLMLGYYPPYNSCLPYSIGKESEFFNGTLFEICGFAKNAGNGKGDLHAKNKQN